MQRRRQNWGLIEASVYYRVSIAKYAAWELDRHSDYPKVYVGTLSLGEQCYIVRTRERVPLEEISPELMGVPVEELHKMEVGQIPCYPLVQYWSERGLL